MLHLAMVWLVIAFVLYAIYTVPRQVANLVRSIIGAIGHFMEALIIFFISLLG